MKSKDQILLEEAYKLVCEEEFSLNRWKPFIPLERADKDLPCSCKSGKKTKDCCARTAEVGNLVRVNSDSKEYGAFLYNDMLPEYKQQWDAMLGKVGELLGYKEMYSNDILMNGQNRRRNMYGVKSLEDGVVYTIDPVSLSLLSKEEEEHLKKLQGMHDKLPETRGLFD